MNRIQLIALICAAFGATTPSMAQKAPKTDVQALVNQYIAASFLPGEGQDLSRLKVDETIQTCNQYRDNPPDKVAEAINEREAKTIKYPDGGKLMGDWKNGEKLYAGGFGMRIGRIEPDPPDRQKGGNGGNCYACHAADPKEIAFGTLGPSLTGYGKLRGTGDDIIKYTYDKIYNAQAFSPCSQMPRMGYHGILRPEQIADIVAYLISPDSPVNK